jgi:signal peptidase I
MLVLTLSVLAVAGFCATFVMVTVRGDSMNPTLRSGDRVLVLRRWVDRRPRRADVVIARPPLPGGAQLWIKRVRAVTGDRAVGLDPRTRLDKEFVLSDREVFLVGDHEAGSFDSRQYGAVSIDDIIGRVVHRFRSTSGTAVAGSGTGAGGPTAPAGRAAPGGPVPPAGGAGAGRDRRRRRRRAGRGPHRHGVVP